MLVFWALRTVSAAAWFGIFIFLVLIPVEFLGFGLSPQSGAQGSLQGMLVTLVFAVALFTGGFAFRIRSQRRSLELLTASKGARLSFAGSPDSATSRWLLRQNVDRRVRWVAPSSVYVVATGIGLEVYWPLRLPSELFIHGIRWDEVADFSVRQRLWLRNESTVTLRGEQRALRFRLARTSLLSSGQQGEDLQIAVRRGRS